jgi:hypothetical protein
MSQILKVEPCNIEAQFINVRARIEVIQDLKKAQQELSSLKALLIKEGVDVQNKTLSNLDCVP